MSNTETNTAILEDVCRRMNALVDFLSARGIEADAPRYNGCYVDMDIRISKTRTISLDVFSHHEDAHDLSVDAYVRVGRGLSVQLETKYGVWNTDIGVRDGNTMHIGHYVFELEEKKLIMRAGRTNVYFDLKV